jgi:plastocyanin
VRRAAALSAVLGAALGGCGEDRGASVSTQTEPPPPRPADAAPAPAAPAEPPPAQVTLAESEYRLEPARIRVDRPATLAIKVRNTGAERHALVVERGGERGRTRVLAPGSTQVLTVALPKPGRYRWYCPVDGHAKRGMRGTVQVARGG